MQYRRPRRGARRFQQISPALLALIDIAAIGIALIVFALFDHVLPRPEAHVETKNVTVAAQSAVTASDTAGEAPNDDVQTEPQQAAVPAAAAGDFSARFPDKFTDGEVIATDTSYQSANVNITWEKVRVEESDQTYFVQDIYIRNIECLRTVFAKDTFGRAITENVLPMAQRANAIAAINSDFYGHGSAGVVIRNGELYRDTWADGEEVLILFRDGTMRGYTREADLDVQQAMRDGAWQSFSFGPVFLMGDGQLRPEGYAKTNHDPRTVIGMVEPGHYKFIVIDGRQDGYARGLTLTGTAMLCQELGLQTAYNLDGGKTSQMVFMNTRINHPYKDGRATSDIVCIVDGI